MKKLYLEQKIFKIEDHYQIFDENEDPVYNVDEEFRFLKKYFEITNNKTGEVTTIEKQISFFLPEYNVTFPNKKKITLQKQLAFFKKSIYGEYVVSLLGSGFLILILTVLNHKKLNRGIMRLKISFKGKKINRNNLETFLKEYHSEIKNYTMENIMNNGTNEYRYVFEIEYRGFVDKIKFIDSYIEKNKDVNYIELN